MELDTKKEATRERGQKYRTWELSTLHQPAAALCSPRGREQARDGQAQATMSRFESKVRILELFCDVGDAEKAVAMAAFNFLTR